MSAEFVLPANKPLAEVLAQLGQLVEESTEVLVGLATADSRVYYINTAGRKLLGLPDLAARPDLQTFDFFRPEDQTFVESTIRPQLWSTGHWEGPFQFRHFGTGEAVPVQVCLSLLRDPATGQPNGIAATGYDIAERQRVGTALRESEERSRQLIEGAGEPFFLFDVEGRLLDVNSAACVNYGYSRQEFLAMRVADIDLDFDPVGTPRRWREMQSGQPVTVEARSRRQDGTVFLAEVRMSVIETGSRQRLLLALVRDMTPHKEMQAALQSAHDGLELRVAERTAELESALRENSTLAAAIDSASTAVLICDPRQPDSPVVFANPAFTEITGYSREEVLGRNCRFLQGPDTDPKEVGKIRTALAERIPYRGVLRNYRKDGTPFWHGLTISPVFDAAGELVRFVGVQVDMTARVEALEEARRKEAQLALAQRVAKLGSWEQAITPEGKPVAGSLVCSDEALRILGHEPGVEGNLFSLFIKGVHPDDREAFVNSYVEALRTAQHHSFDHRVIRPDGLIRVVHQESDVVCDAATGRPRQVVGIIQDITESAYVTEIGRHLTAARDLPEMLRRCTQSMVDRLGATLARIWTLNAEASVLELRASSGLYTHLDGAHGRVPVGQFKIGRIASERRPHLSNEIQGNPREPEQAWAREQGLVGFAGYPLIVEGRLVGVMAMFARRAIPERTQEAMTVVAPHIALGVERKRAETSAAHLAAIVESSEDAIIRKTLEGIVTSWNLGAERLYGFTEAEALGKPCADLIFSPELMAAEKENLQRIPRGEHFAPFETVRRKKNGALIDVSIRLSAITDATGAVIAISSISRDISERKRTEAALRASEARNKAILETALDCIITIDEWGRVFEFNASAERTFGYARAEAIGQPLDELIIPEDLRAAHREGLARYLRTTEERVLGQRLELPAQRADGEKIMVELTISRIPIEGPPLFTGYLRDITERSGAEEALRQSEQNYRALFDANPLPAWVYDLSTLAFLEVNLAAIAHYGYSREEFLAMTLRDTRAPEDIPALLARLAALGLGPSPLHLSRHRKKDGTLIEVEVVNVPILFGGRSARLAIVQDVTERRRTEQALRASEARFGRMVANVPGMVYRFVLHPDGSCELPFVSDGCREIYGLEPEEARRDARLLLNATHPDDQLAAQQTIAESARTLQPWVWDGRIVHPRTGEVRCLEGISRPERLENGDVVWDGVLMDVTERKQAEGHRLGKETAERASSAKSEYLSRISHELRTPLNAILGFGQLLELSDLTTRQSESVQHILGGGRHLLQLVDEVLDISKVESGRIEMSPEPVDIHELVRETLALMHPLAAQRDISLQLSENIGSAVPGRGAHVLADRQRLKQVVLNLLSNAVKYNHRGGCVLLDYAPPAPGHLRLRIANTGTGISDEMRARMFTPFDRLGSEQRGTAAGTGLGLALSKRLVDAMRGSLGLEAQPAAIPGLASDAENPGAVFWLELPLAASPLDSVVKAATARRAVLEPLPGGRKLLYVEDNLSNLKLIEQLLEMHPEVCLLTAMQGTLGLELAAQHQPDLILLDVHLPDLPGWEVLRRLRADEQTRDIPVVVLSADTTPRRRERLLEAGALDYLTKPLDVQKFFALMRQIFLARESADDGGEPAAR